MNRKCSIFQQNSLPIRSTEFTPMIYLCRFRQRTRLIEIPLTSQQNGISHEQLRQLIIQEFQLQSSIQSKLIIQFWHEHYQEYIDIESYKRIPFEGRLQVLIEKDFNSNEDCSSIVSPQINMKIERLEDESLPTFEQSNLIYDLLPKPIDGIPIPRFPPHITAFLNGNNDANQLNALVQALYQEIVKYELYPSADELRSIVNRLIDRYPHCLTVIGSLELLVRKLYYKFCNERKKYPIEFKRRQPNKRKRHIREDDSNDFHQSSLNQLMHLWTNVQQSNSSSSTASSPLNSNTRDETSKSHPLNLSLTNLCTE